MSAFATTQWSLLLAARKDDAHAVAALSGICAQYRRPVLDYIRHAGHSQTDAEDLTQSFFVHFLERRADHAADPARGRFRQLLRAQLRYFLCDAHVAAHTLKRGGGMQAADASELDHAADPALPPDRSFDRGFALSVIDRALARLREQQSTPASRLLFDALSPVLFEPRDQGALLVIAQAHGIRANTLAVTLKRLRDRLAQQIRAELGQLVADPHDIDDEMRALRAALRADPPVQV